ncbi:pyridoxal-dependent decarboxylase [Paenibacillus terrae HPL-003]|uniref:Pyridoxal-dependent decarboxylase n=1 Tax=Paenibacillus terrae (strain HPL-003) TaxID=985665 RepID=G7VR99_PAETH|nr:aminotransferase class V-fold PLP-dependent enzyme [Paenibacillus terrae]AET61998.1 pyridoxal-dependent decarboxylase [Paenibacillus terrae HPL-003]
MGHINLQNEMMEQLKTKELMEQAKTYAYDYIENLPYMDVSPSCEALENLLKFEEKMPEESASPSEILFMLHKYGSKATVAKSGAKYFGFVNGGVIPVALATKWLTDIWDQNSGLYIMSPIASKLEEVCEKWLVDLFGLQKGTAAGFVSGSSVATICAVTAARNKLLFNQGYDVHSKGLFGAPKIRVVVGEDAHSSVWKALSMLGIGRDMVEVVPTDDQGRMIIGKLPPLDSKTLVIAQAGNVTGGAFDSIEEICTLANQASAWVHVDGAFGLWAAVSGKRKYLTKGLEKADSWSVDAHKTLNAPFDCGVVLCKDRDSLVSAMQASGSYLQYSDHRDGMLYVPELSKRARSVELWAVIKYLGKVGIEKLVDDLCDNAEYFAEKLTEQGFHVENNVVFNQIVVKCENSEITSATLKNIQASRKCWCSGALWQNEPAIRISICSWQTTQKDIDDCVNIFVACRRLATPVIM